MLHHYLLIISVNSVADQIVEVAEKQKENL